MVQEISLFRYHNEFFFARHLNSILIRTSGHRFPENSDFSMNYPASNLEFTNMASLGIFLLGFSQRLLELFSPALSFSDPRSLSPDLREALNLQTYLRLVDFYLRDLANFSAAQWLQHLDVAHEEGFF